MSSQNTVNKGEPLRCLLPGPGPAQKIPRNSNIAPRIDRVTAACKQCRDRKSKCSGERPACRTCVRRRLDCEYDARRGETNAQAMRRNYDNLLNRAEAYEEIVELLKNRPAHEAGDILERLRSGTPVTTIVNHVKAADLLMQISVVPETRFRYDFPYRSEMPIELTVDNPYSDALIYEVTSLYPNQEYKFSDRITSRLGFNLGSDEHQSLYLKPFHAAQVVDPLLTTVRISHWTAACKDDALMRELLEVFFRCEYHFSAAFHKDYFLEDMAAERNELCSSLLVNAVLAYSCACSPRFANRAEYWNTETYLYRFNAEAKRLWELEAKKPRLTTIQAGIIFSVFHNLCGLDEVGQAYRIQAIALANQMRIFDNTVGGENKRVEHVRAFTAWALFNWESLTAFSFNFSPWLKTPPSWTLPDPSKNAQWYGEIWVQYPLNSRRSSSYFSHVFRSRSQFRIIMNQFCQEAYSNGSCISLDTANKFRLQLQAWYEGLPEPLQPKAIVLPGHIQLHIYYHHLILSIYEPLLDVKAVGEHTPQKLVTDAKKYIQTLARIYYLRHGFDAMDLFICIPLILIGYDCISLIPEELSPTKLETLRSTLILVAQGLYSQSRNHYLCAALFRVVQQRMRPQEIALLRDTMDLSAEEAEGKKAMEQEVRSHWPVSVVKKKEDMEDYILTNLVENYSRLDVEEVVEEDNEGLDSA